MSTQRLSTACAVSTQRISNAVSVGSVVYEADSASLRLKKNCDGSKDSDEVDGDGDKDSSISMG